MNKIYIYTPKIEKKVKFSPPKSVKLMYLIIKLNYVGDTRIIKKARRKIISVKHFLEKDLQISD